MNKYDKQIKITKKTGNKKMAKQKQNSGMMRFFTITMLILITGVLRAGNNDTQKPKEAAVKKPAKVTLKQESKKNAATLPAKKQSIPSGGIPLKLTDIKTQTHDNAKSRLEAVRIDHKKYKDVAEFETKIKNAKRDSAFKLPWPVFLSPEVGKQSEFERLLRLKTCPGKWFCRFPDCQPSQAMKMKKKTILNLFS